jgi:hypothetical protein
MIFHKCRVCKYKDRLSKSQECVVKDDPPFECLKHRKWRIEQGAKARYAAEGLNEWDHADIPSLNNIKQGIAYFYGRDAMTPASLIAKHFLLDGKTIKIVGYKDLIKYISGFYKEEYNDEVNRYLTADCLIIRDFVYEATVERKSAVNTFLAKRSKLTVIVSIEKADDAKKHIEDFNFKVNYQGKFREEEDLPIDLFA